MIRKEAHRLQRAAEDTVEDIKDSAEHTSNGVREKVNEARHDGQEWLDDQTRQANKTASKVRNAVVR